MNLRRAAAALVAVPLVIGATALRASAVPAEDACNASPDGGYTLCLLWTQSDGWSRRNDIVFLAVNDDPDTPGDEGGIDANLYQYESGYGYGYGYFEGESAQLLGGYSGYATGAQVLAHDLFGHDRLIEVAAEHGGYDSGYYGDGKFTEGFVTVWDQSGNSTDAHATLYNGTFFGQPYGSLEAGVAQDGQNGYRFAGLRSDESGCGVYFGHQLAACPVNVGVPPNPQAVPFLPIP